MEHFGHALIAAETQAPDRLSLRLGRDLGRAAGAGVTGEELERARRRLLGQRLRVFHGPEPLAHWLLANALEGTTPTDGYEEVAGATVRAVTARLRALAFRLGFAPVELYDVLLRLGLGFLKGAVTKGKNRS